MATDWLSYQNQNATRNQPLSPKLVEAMSFLPSMGVSMKVHSGGETEDRKASNSGRHLHGNAGDVDFYQNGRKLDWNNSSDLPILSSIVSQAKANGVTGIGAGDDYMGAGRFHIGFGNPGVWGAGGSSKNAPSWLRDAYYGTPGAVPTMAYAPLQQTASTPATRAINSATQGEKPKGLFGTIMGLVPKDISLPEISPGMQKQIQSTFVGPMMKTVAGRTMLANMLLPSNIGPAPTITPGTTGPGTAAMSVSNSGINPVMLSSGSGGGYSPIHQGQNMDVYRANSAVLGGGNINQSNINSALSSGKTLYRLA